MEEMDEGNTKKARENVKQLKEEMGELNQLGRQFGRTMGTAFQEIALKGKSLRDVFRSLALDLAQLALKAAFKPLEQAAGNFFTQLLASGAGFAKGAAFKQSMPVPFAKGGVISSPVAFPLGKGGTGIAGEAGAEAIMPLARGADGRLGVTANGGGGVRVIFNVTTPDAQSFRRSESQVAAMLARAVGQGQRNL